MHSSRSTPSRPSQIGRLLLGTVTPKGAPNHATERRSAAAPRERRTACSYFALPRHGLVTPSAACVGRFGVDVEWLRDDDVLWMRSIVSWCSPKMRPA